MPKSSTEHDRYVLHLNQALAMESALVDHLEKRAAAVPDAVVRERILLHREETMQHRETVRDCIQAVGGEPTATRAVVQSPIVPGLIGKVMTALESEKEDKLLLENLADYAVEHYEAALYGGLGLIARNVGYPQHAARFQQIREQERAMADFIAARQAPSIEQAFPPLPQAA